MKFLHESADFEDLLTIVGEELGIDEALVEKDYWVTHTLWAIQRSGLEIYFKGGTSLSKGFGVVQRFSEDIDAWLKPGTLAGLAEVTHWTRESKGHTQSRRSFYQALPEYLEIPAVTVELDTESLPEKATGALFFLRYPGRHLAALEDGPNRPYIQLEVGYTEIIPNVPVTIRSFLHDHLASIGRGEDFEDNRPHELPTVHPLSTLIEKLDAISRRYNRDGETFAPEAFVRHYEDAAWILRKLDDLPEIAETPQELVHQMLGRKQIRWIPDPKDAAFLLADPEKKGAIETAYEAIQHMFWGERIPLSEACEEITTWLRGLE